MARTSPDDPRRITLIGRPNVGKSPLLNRLAGSERVVVDSVAGTTRDPVDELVDLGGRPRTFVDTAGMRTLVEPGTDLAPAVTSTRNKPRSKCSEARLP